MNLVKIFDAAKKKFEVGDKTDGYVVNGVTYTAYLNNQDWQNFKEEMELKCYLF